MGSRTVRDPNCGAYRRIFSYITDRAIQEVFSEENVEDVVRRIDLQNGMLRHGRLLSIMRDSPHPKETAHHARRILGAVALATTGSPVEASRKLQELRLPDDPEWTLTTLQAHDARLKSRVTGVNNLYLHITFACNLRCAHCYCQAGLPSKGELSVGDVIRACRDAKRLGFRHVVVTGGEPLVHSQHDVMMDALAEVRQELKPLLTVLRTNLAMELNEAHVLRLAHSTDEVVVSVDGNRATHDAQRGTGQYHLTVRNLRKLVDAKCTTDLSIAVVLPESEACGPAGDAGRELSQRLGIRRVRYRPLLPLGRAAVSGIDIRPDALWAHKDPHEVVVAGFKPVASCGIGQNLYVEPDGAAYPCYAWHGEEWHLGNIAGEIGLEAVVHSAAFENLRRHTVNTNRRCKSCAMRYLCGGACRAWNRQPECAQHDLNSAPPDCSRLYQRARSLVDSALERLKIPPRHWLAAGLALPNSEPTELAQSNLVTIGG